MPKLGIGAQHLLNKLFGSLILQSRWEIELALENFLIDMIGIIGISPKRQLAIDELVEHDTHCPQVHHLVILLALDHLGRHVMRRSNDSGGLMSLPNPLAGPEGHQLQIAAGIHYEVFGFEIPQDYLFVLQVLQEQHHASNIELAVFAGEEADVPDDIV